MGIGGRTGLGCKGGQTGVAMSGGGSISTDVEGEGGVVAIFVLCVDVICKMSMCENV